MIYFAEIVGTNLIKIGRSDDPRERIKAFPGTKAKLLLCLDAPDEAEGDLHRRFSHLRRGCNWTTETFVAAPELLSFIDAPTNATITQFMLGPEKSVRTRVRYDAAIRLKTIRRKLSEARQRHLESFANSQDDEGLPADLRDFAAKHHPANYLGLGINLEAKLEMLCEWNHVGLGEMIYILLCKVYSLKRFSRAKPLSEREALEAAVDRRNLLEELCIAAESGLIHHAPTSDDLGQMLYRDLGPPSKQAFHEMLAEAIAEFS